MTVDLKMNNLTVASTVMQGLDFNFSYTIQNIGNATSAFSNAAYMFDQMADPMHYAGFDLINPLQAVPNGIQVQSDHFNTAGLSVGQHTLYVVPDNWTRSATPTGATTSCRSPSRSRRRSSRTSW